MAAQKSQATIWLLLALLQLLVHITTANTKECPLKASLHLENTALVPGNVTRIVPDANLIFTVFLPEVDCDSSPEEKRNSEIYLNAVSYAVEILNNVTSDPKHDVDQLLPFFPMFGSSRETEFWPENVKFGADIVSVASTVENSQKMKNLKCKTGEVADSKIEDLALFDGAGLLEHLSGASVLEQFPVISLSPKDSILNTAFKANLIVNLLEVLDWKHFAIITTRHEDSMYIVKILGQIAHSGQICISDIFEWERRLSNGSAENQMLSFLNGVLRPDVKIPILVVTDDDKQVAQMVQMFNAPNFEPLMRHFQMFFSLIPSPELFGELRKMSKHSTVYTLNSQLPSIPDISSHVFSQKTCRSMDSGEVSLNSDMWTKWLSFLPVRSILSVAFAFNRALRDACKHQSTTQSKSLNETSAQPWCDQFGDIERRHFFTYISALEDQMESSLMSFGSIEHDGAVNDLLLYNGDQFRVLSTATTATGTGATIDATNSSSSSSSGVVTASNCHNSQCSSCVKFRQSRDQSLVDNDGDDDENEPRNRYGGHHAHQNLHLLLNAQESGANTNGEESPSSSSSSDEGVQVETHEINLGLILPLHKSGSSVMECSRELNLPAYFVSEAAKWIVDKINQNNYLIPGIEVKLEMIDTCSSSYFATQQLAQLTSSEAKVQPIAFVGTMPREHYRPVVDFVSAINYTMIATQDISDLDVKFGPKFGVLQTATTMPSLLNVAIEQMKYFGWRYVTVVVNPADTLSVQMFHLLSEAAAHEKICFASVEEIGVSMSGPEEESKMNVTLTQMAENYHNGAQVVLLLTNYAATRTLTAAIQSANKRGALKAEKFHFLSLRDQNLETIHGSEEEFMGSIFIRESIGKIAHFDNHFLDLLANPKPKDQNLFQFIDQCGENSAQCLRLINSFDRTVVTNTMQAILAIVGGFARMRNETCAGEQGICNAMLESNFHRSLLNYILNTRSMRIDTIGDRRFKSDTNDVFEFAPDGSSGRDIELLNFKHDFSNGLFRFDTVALWSHTTRQLIKNPNLRYIFYRFNGIVKGHKEYNETELIGSDCSVLKRCPQCEPQTPEFIYMPSWDQLLITGIFDVHAHTAANPLICDKNATKLEAIENVEAFLWAVEMINNDPDILPGVHLGALLFDTCSSYQKIYRDISNFLSNSLLLGENIQMPTPDSVVGFLVDGQNSKILDSILDLTNPLKISVLSSQAKEAKYQSPATYSQFLGFSLPNTLYVSSIAHLLVNYKWNFVSVLYENDLQSRAYFDAFQMFERASMNKSIKFASKELFDSEDLHENLEHLKNAHKAGSRVLVTFLSEQNLNRFLEYNAALPEEKRLPTNDLLLITIGNRRVLQRFPSVNALSIDEERNVIPEFREYFKDLSIQSNMKNPWFTKLWEKAFDCEGFACFRTAGSLRQKNVTIDGKTSTIINSVYTLAHALELLRQQLCPASSRGLCRNFRTHQRQLSKAEYGTIKQHQFIGLDGSHVAFSPDSNFRLGHLSLFNNRVEGSWERVGRFDAENGLLVSDSKTRVAIRGDRTTFSRLISACTDSKRCGSTSSDNSLTLPIVKSANQPEAVATIALVLPLHGTGNRCEPLAVGVFERLLSFFYALDMVNQRASSALNVLVLDDCRFRKPVALQQLASVENFRVLPKIVSIVSLSEKSNVSTQLYSMLSDYSPFVYNFEPLQQEQRFVFQNPDTRQLASNDVNTGNQLIRTLVDLCSRNRWQMVSLVFTNEFVKNYFVFQANEHNICVERSLQVTMKDIARVGFKQEWQQFTNGLDSRIVVLLTGSDVVEFLVKYSDQRQLDEFVWLGDQSLKQGSANAQKIMKKTFKKQIVVRTRADVDQFDRVAMTSMLEGMTRYFDIDGNRIAHNNALSLWLREYWMRKFHCHVSGHERPACLDVKLARKALLHPRQLNSVYQFSKILGSSIAGFVEARCNKTTVADDSCLLNLHTRSELKTAIIQQLSKNNLLKDADSSSSLAKDDAMNYEVQVLHNYGKMLNTFASFQWSPETTVALNRSLAIANSCDRSCDFCRVQLANNRNKNNQLLFTADSISSPLTGPLSAHRNCAIAASILSTLGLIVVLICVLYFILIFPIQLGTTIIGYQILLGLFFCYLINFAHLLPVSGSLCWVRFNGLNMAYTIILSGLFVKSYNYLSQARVEKLACAALPFNSPLALLFLSVILIIVQTTLLVFPSKTTSSTCIEIGQLEIFHRETLGQLFLPGILMILTLGFSVNTLKNAESKWILVCSLTTLSAWLAWLGYDLRFHRESHSISIVFTNIFIATTLIVLLYIRKLYLFSKISRKILKERRANMDAHAAYAPFADPQAQYGALHAADSLSWSQSSGKGGQFRNATRSPFETDNEDNVSSCGSVKSSNSSSQVQTQELYPMEVYENQLGASAMNRIGASTRSVYDIIHESKDFNA